MTLPEAETSRRYCGRLFNSQEILWIGRFIVDHPSYNRVALSRAVCDALGWIKPDGRRKEMSCRVAMLRMHRDDLICLPAPQKGNGNGRTCPAWTSASDPQFPVSMSAGDLGPLQFHPVSTAKDGSLWNELIDRYHYLGYKPLPGAQIRYLVFSNTYLLAALGFGAAAWKVAPRDHFVGWTTDQRARNLHLVVNNARFLILPWVTSRNLASRILAGVAKQLPQDWQMRYRYSPVLLETFVDTRFAGTCYKAANWLLVGQTQGRGKLDRHHHNPLPVKHVFLYPLRTNSRQILCA
ncbi:MAG: DUF4338 domain-containing protein [Elusimicrobia bacterium]|nr:DUF4338 domain-containing protein [Elusimicrobiota bacterium]